MRFDSLDKWLVWLESCHPSEIDLGLERVSLVASMLQLDFSSTRVITVAGTNGKGSSVAAINHLLRSAQYSVGCYTSPHFLSYNERIIVNDQAATDHAIMQSFHRVDQARGQTSLTYFEFGTLAALDIFSHSDLDVIVLEVGLGGRLDAVNIVDSDIAVLTTVDIDHQDWLGDNRESIGAEKAGIFRADNPVICGDDNPPQSVIDMANHLDCQFLQINDQFTLLVDDNGAAQWQGIDYHGDVIAINGLNLPQLPRSSVAVAIQALQLLNFERQPDYNRFAELALVGRYQKTTYQDKHIVLDVAHNPASARYLADQLSSHSIIGKTFALTSIMSDKDIIGMVEPLSAIIDTWYVGNLSGNSRALSATALAVTIKDNIGGNVIEAISVQDAFQQVLSIMNDEDRLVVFGSFFTVAEIMAYIQNEK